MSVVEHFVHYDPDGRDQHSDRSAWRPLRGMNSKFLPDPLLQLKPNSSTAWYM
jgi:hypothetical protein